MSNFDKVKVRFAPSPTGHLHVGSVRVAIFNWLYAKSLSGEFLVRIEDTDLERSKEHFVSSIKSSLSWLGLAPDQDYFLQSKNEELHVAAVNQLLSQGLAYRCFCSQEELSSLREQSGPGFKYPQTCRKMTDNQNEQLSFVVRIKIPDNAETISFEDAIRGKIELSKKEIDDFILLRADGSPTYNLSVVVDDAEMKISHVLRGEDHIINTFRQIFLYQALKKPVPTFAHLPLILGSSGERLSKRDCATSVDQYKLLGFLPDALFNYLLRLGWSHGDQEVFSKQEATQHFSLKQIGKKGAIFDFQKLSWLNQTYLQKLTFQEFKILLLQANENLADQFSSSFPESILLKLFELYRERTTTTIELATSIIAIADFQKQLKAKEIQLDLSEKESELLKEFYHQAQEKSFTTALEFQTLAKTICKEKGEKIPVIAKALRYSLTGNHNGPGAFALMEILNFDFFIKKR